MDSDVSFKIYKFMLRRRHIDADPGRSRLRSALAVLARPFWIIGWAFQERLLWPLGDLFRSIVELLKWPFQRLGWGVERRLVWPSRERVASWGLLRRFAGAGALVAIATSAAVWGVVLASQEEPAGKPAKASRIALATPVAVKAEPAEPALRGTPPVFGVEDGVKISSAEAGQPGAAAVEADAAEQTEPESESGEEATTGAAASSQKSVPAGPDAMKVARRFSEAFVFYEVGKKPARAKAIFEETATPRLATALAERPPRLPVNAKVPQARVLNLVPGPRRAKSYTVSVSLLRVGVTSELRLKMKKRDGAWVITDVRG
ncbi:MAG: hypothetical protein WD827_08795 [Solirubrobacterales bacterium]